MSCDSRDVRVRTCVCECVYVCVRVCAWILAFIGVLLLCDLYKQSFIHISVEHID